MSLQVCSMPHASPTGLREGREMEMEYENADRIWSGLGKEQWSLWMGDGADSNTEDHWPKPPYLDRSERAGRQHLPIPPLTPNLQAQLLPNHSPHWPILLLCSITSSPIAHSTFSTPARGSPPDEFVIPLPPPPQRCGLIRWFVIKDLPSLQAA